MKTIVILDSFIFVLAWLPALEAAGRLVCLS